MWIMISKRRFQILLDAFFDGFGFTGLFTRVRRPGAPESYFRRDEDVSPDFPVK
jgi:hypothetical protein